MFPFVCLEFFWLPCEFYIFFFFFENVKRVCCDSVKGLEERNLCLPGAGDDNNKGDFLCVKGSV